MPNPDGSIPITGLSQLGDVLARGGEQYAQMKYAKDRDADRRAEYLADVQSERQFLTSESNREEANRIKDEQVRLLQSLQANTAQSLINEGLLDPSQANDPAAIQEAFSKAKMIHAESVNQDLLSTPDPSTGAPLLSPDKVTDPAAVAAAKQRYYQIKGAQNPQASVDAMERQLLALQQKADHFDEGLSAEIPAPTPEEVRQRAEQMANTLHPTGLFHSAKPSMQEINAQMEPARAAIADEKKNAFILRHPDVVQERELLASRLNSLSKQIEATKVTPSASVFQEPPPSGAPAAAAVTPPSKSVTPEMAAQAFQSIIDKVRAPAGAPIQQGVPQPSGAVPASLPSGPSLLLNDPTMAPAPPGVLPPAVDGQPTAPPMSPLSAFAFQNPGSDPAKAATALLQKKAVQDSAAARMKSLLLGLQPSGSSISTSDSFTPAFA